MFLEVMSMIFLTLPIVYPIVISLGFDGIWFGILLVKMMEIAGITPPVGLNVYVIKSIAGEDVTLGDVFRGVSWFFAAEIVTVVILVAFPQIILWLPNTMLG
jgi:TRAP-type C4-dicarboxylate transport system permease large subunit